jgi:hypothetical protein
MLVVWRSNGDFWLFSDFLTGVPERPLCDPIADVRESTLEWPFWVDSSRSRSSHFGQERTLACALRNVRLQIRKRPFGRRSSNRRVDPQQ